MNQRDVVWVLRADAIFNFIAGVVSLFYLAQVLAAIGWPDTTDGRIYASTLGAALIGLSVGVWLASNHPVQGRDTIIAGIIAKTLAGLTILYYIFGLQTPLPSPWLLPAAVVVQVLFVLGELGFLLSSRGE
jgi:hypothetical protein